MNLNNVNLIKHNGSEIALIKLNGSILYKKDKDTNQYYIEYTVDNTITSSLSLYESPNNYGLPRIYSDEYIYSFQYDKVEITLLDGTITDDVTTTCDHISKVKLWYPENTMAVKFCFESIDETNPFVKQINYINTDNLTDMVDMFVLNNSVTSINASNWDTRKITDMSRMFGGCESLMSVDVSNFDTSNVTTIEYMFSGCKLLEALDVSKWNTGKVTIMNNLFQGCSSLTSLDLSNWNTNNVTIMGYMFRDCNSLIDLDVSKWNTDKVTNMVYLFNGCSSLTELDLSNWNTSNVTSMTTMFGGCSSLTSLNLSNFDLVNTSVTGRINIFNNCTSLHTLRLDNCSNDTINKLLKSKFPTGTIEGITRRIYCKEANTDGLTAPDGWVFEYID